MRRYGPAVLLLLTAGAVLRISLFGDLYLRYVQAGLRPYLIASGALLGLLGLVRAALTGRTPREGTDRERADREDALTEHQDAHGHGHSHPGGGPRVAWLLALPAAALLLFPPPALGSYSAARDEGPRPSANGVGTFPPLPAVDPVDLSVAEFGSRAVYDSGRSLQGRTVRLTGFVTRGDGSWYVTRLLVGCCAADATAGRVEVLGAPAPEPDTWVTVTGIWRPEGGPGPSATWPPLLDARTVTRVPEPSDPYEKR
ncbi:TIGR03943 family putative permease subunit [Streptomyces poriticola]|uniref:TIGR03943 family putative permease subunit n=1 Tax=Streptomyces poriticola TaxID=3120506 RepID=UPI002FCDEA2D